MITAWLVATSLLYTLHVICILANWYGVLRERPLWLIPKIVLKLFTITFCIASTVAVGYFLWDESYLLKFLIAQSRDKEYYAAKSTLAIGGSVLFLTCAIFTAIQVGLLKILLDSFNHIQSMYIERLIEQTCNDIRRPDSLDFHY